MGAVGAVILTGSRGSGDMRECLLSHVGGDYHLQISLGFKTSAQLETRLSVHSPLPHISLSLFILLSYTGLLLNLEFDIS